MSGRSTMIAAGDPAVDQRAFRHCLGQYATGVAVITGKAGERLLGMTVNSFASVSLDPPLVLWSIRKTSDQAAAFLQADGFGVNVLAADQITLSRRFSGAVADRFADVPWTPGHGGMPLLNGVIAHFECRGAAIHDGGDHAILIGHVVRFAHFTGEPLLFVQGRYALPQARDETVQTLSPQVGREPSLMKLLSLATQRLSAEFQRHQRTLDCTPAASRVLTRLLDGPATHSELERDTALIADAVKDAVQDLIGSGDIAAANGVVALTTAGTRKSEALITAATAVMAAKTTGLSDADIATTRRVLRALQSA